MNDQYTRRDGFTLIELLVVVVIIGLLAAIAVPKLAATKDKSKLASIRSDIRNLMSAQEAYYVDYNTYTTSFSGNVFAPSQGNSVTISATASEFTVTISNPSITSGWDECTVTVGSGQPTDSQIICS